MPTKAKKMNTSRLIPSPFFFLLPEHGTAYGTCELVVGASVWATMSSSSCPQRWTGFLGTARVDLGRDKNELRGKYQGMKPGATGMLHEIINT